MVIGYPMHGDILSLKLKDQTKLDILGYFRPIGLAYAAENFSRIINHANLKPGDYWKMDNTVGGISNGVLFQKCFSSVICELGDDNLDLFRNQRERIFKLCYQAGLYLQAINNLSDFILPNPSLTTTEKTGIS